jgi:hypothetical protein
MTYAHSPLTAALLHSLVPVVLPPEANDLADDVVAHVALTMGALPTNFRRALITGLYGYDTLAVAWAPGGRRAPPAAGRPGESLTVSWEHGPTPAHQQLAKGVGQLIKLACYEHPAMRPRSATRRRRGSTRSRGGGSRSTAPTSRARSAA